MSVDNGIKQLVIPPGGWKYEQPVDNGGTVLIEGQTYPLLEKKVLEFRQAHIEVIESGTATREAVREDLNIFICGRYPQQCAGAPVTPSRSAETKAETMAYMPPITRMEHWFKRISSMPLEWTDAGQAVARAQICVNCPKNIKWENHCRGCIDSLNRRVVRYKGDRVTPLDSNLRACWIYGHHNSVAVWLKNTHSDAKEAPPVECWKK